MSKLAVIVVDMQGHFIYGMAEERRKKLIDYQLEVLKECATKNIPVIILEYVGSGETVCALSEAILQVPRNKTIIKSSDDGFYGTNLNEVLKKWGVEIILLMGVNASCCVKETALSAREYGYKIATGLHLIADSSCNNYATRNLTDSLEWYQASGLFFPGPFSLTEAFSLV